MWTAITIGVLGIVLIGGVVAWALHLSKELGEAYGEIENLEARNAWLSQALRARGAADPDLDDLVLPVPGKDDSSSA